MPNIDRPKQRDGLQSDGRTVMLESDPDGIRARKAVEEIVEATIFLDDDDDVLNR